MVLCLVFLGRVFGVVLVFLVFPWGRRFFLGPLGEKGLASRGNAALRRTVSRACPECLGAVLPTGAAGESICRFAFLEALEHWDGGHVIFTHTPLLDFSQGLNQ